MEEDLPVDSHYSRPSHLRGGFDAGVVDIGARTGWIGKWIFVLAFLLCAHAFAGGNWLTLANPAKAAVMNLILLSDGTVLCANNPDLYSGNAGFVWYRLTPDPFGHYTEGEWSDISSMHDSRLAYTSQLLADGRLFVAGGEYGSGRSTAEIYDPLDDTWTYVNPPASILDPTQPSPSPAGGPNQGFVDSESTVLPNGNVLINPVSPKAKQVAVIYNPISNTWSNAGIATGIMDEASWVKLPDGSVLTVNTDTNNSERYIPSLNQWIQDKNLPVSIWQPLGTNYAGETGPAFLLPNGNAIFFGGNGHTAIYTPSGSTNFGNWIAGPDIPGGLGSADGPGAMMPNGIILLTATQPPFVDGSGKLNFTKPTSFFEYDYSAGPVGTFTQVNGPTGLTESLQSEGMCMLMLPDGSVLFSDSTEQNFPATGAKLYVYVPSGNQVSTGRPSISTITPNADGSFHLTGYNLNGISEGGSYGDDEQMSTDYPIIQFQDTNNAHIDYGRTFNWTGRGGAYGAGTVEFTLPAGLIPQTYLVSVSANGIISDPVIFSFVTPSYLALCPGDNGTLSVITTPQPATYQWLRNGSPVSGQTNAQLNIVNATTNDAGYYTLQVSGGNSSTISLPVPVSVGIMEVSQPPITNSAVLCQPMSLSVVARGKGTVSAQWFHNGNLIVPDSRITETNIPAANGALQFQLRFSDIHFQDDATYHVVLTDDCGSVAQPPFALRVTPNPPWVRIATEGPPSRHAAAMCYDSDRRVTVLFGGGTYAAGPGSVLGDTWEFDGTNWTQRLPVNSPVGRTQANMVYDTKRHRAVLFGGLRYDSTYGVRFSPETWEWDGNNWQQIVTAHLPPWTETLYAYAACYDNVRGEMLLFGYLTDPLWSYDGTDWQAKNVGGFGPGFTVGLSAMAFDTSRGVAVLPASGTGGIPGLANYYNIAIWEWDGTNWLERPQSGQQPSLNTSGVALTYDTFRQECVLFGEEDGVIDGHQTTDYPSPDFLRFIWRWNGVQWQADPPTPTIGVASETYHSMCFDSARNALVLFGGIGDGSFDVTNYTYEIVYQDDPAVLKQPIAPAAVLGQSTQLSVVAAGAPVISYQWQKGGVNLTDTANITGTTNDTLTINSAGTVDAGVYQVVLNNICGTATSQPITLTVTAGQLAGAVSGNNLHLSWVNPLAALQSAPGPGGPWTTVPGAISPYQITPSANQAFFRLVQ
jgi:Immunoglobulin I-set domain/Kelch motif